MACSVNKALDPSWTFSLALIDSILQKFSNIDDIAECIRMGSSSAFKMF